ncbi:NUMOD4 motif-containing HNH endonuclease [Campylobacter fetus]|uniref:NUMOD4 motif-containing HNH endonuclease n=1 Tax=Campylobacter fetus TaxID=196 RepID=UPI000FC9A492|nr:NUMOD4 motif-containing HNH endonuclease [Campylobacter fetus]RUT50961.1 hypothetical protein BWK67_00110 [Campylobacter fetus]RUT51689.1 hypothetical protein BWK51_00110 [Campylobacter fetus]
MLNQNEIWKPLKGFEDYYEGSSLGNIRNIKTKKILKTYLINSGYKALKLTINSKRYSVLTHKIIAETFIPNTALNLVVNHKDCNKLNNNITNLEWITQSENCKHAYRIKPEIKERCKSYIGKKHALSKCPYFNVGILKKYHTSLITGKRYLSSLRYCAKVTYNGENLEKRNFKTAEEAAEHVNSIIDKYNLDRPKNIIDYSKPFIFVNA